MSARFVLTGTILSLLSFPALAKDKSYFGIIQDFIYDSNPLLSDTNDDSIFGSETKAFFDFDRQTPTQSLTGRATVIRNQLNDSAFNSTDFAFNGQYEKTSLRWAFSTLAAINYDTTRSGEVSTFGRANQSDRYITWRLRPKIDYTVSQKTQISMQSEIRESHYDNASLTDYRTLSLTPTIATKLDPLKTFFMSLQARRFKSLENTGQTVDSVGPNIGLLYDFHQRYSLEFYAGFLASKYNGYPTINDDWQVNPTYSAILNYKGQRHKTSLGITRTREPFSNGSEYDLTTLRGENQFTINPLWSLKTNALYQKAQDPEFVTDDLDKAWEGEMSLIYKPSENWAIALTQKYRDETLLSGRQADRHIIKLGLTYNFGKTQ